MIKTISKFIRSIIRIVSVLIIIGFGICGFFFPEFTQDPELIESSGILVRILYGVVGLLVGFIFNVFVLGGICLVLETNSHLEEINDKLSNILERKGEYTTLEDW